MNPGSCTTPEERTALVKKLARMYLFDPEFDIDLVYLRKNPRGKLVEECRLRLQERGIPYQVFLKNAEPYSQLSRAQDSLLSQRVRGYPIPLPTSIAPSSYSRRS